MKKRPLIGLLSGRLAPSKAYEVVGEELSVDLMVFTPRGINWWVRQVRGLVYHNGQWKHQTSRFPDAVYNRRYTSNRQVTTRLEKIIGKGKVFNILSRFRKLEIYSILAESGFHSLLIPTSPFDSDGLLAELRSGKQMVIKPNRGSLGRRIYRVSLESGEYVFYNENTHPKQTFANESALISHLQQTLGPKRTFIMQPFVTFSTLNDRVFDIRMLVQKNKQGVWKVSASLSRIAFKSYFVTNVACAIASISELMEEGALKRDISSELEDISVKVAMALERKLGSLGEISVDFGIEANNQVRIIEVNGQPQKRPFANLGQEIYQQVMLTPIQYASHLAERKQR